MLSPVYPRQRNFYFEQEKYQPDRFWNVNIEFLNYIKHERGYSTHTHKAYQKDLEIFLHFLSKYHSSMLSDFSLVDRQTIRHYLGKEFEDGHSSKTVARRLATIKSFFKYLVQAELITDNPAIHVKTPKIENQFQ